MRWLPSLKAQEESISRLQIQYGTLLCKLTNLTYHYNRLEKRMSDFETELKQEDTDVDALLAKDTQDVADRDKALAARDALQQKIDGGNFVSAEERAQSEITLKALEAYLHPAPVPAPAVPPASAVINAPATVPPTT